MISALTHLGGSQRDWALETAARSLKAIADLVAAAENLDVEFEADSVSRARIDAWLEEAESIREPISGPCCNWRPTSARRLDPVRTRAMVHPGYTAQRPVLPRQMAAADLRRRLV